MACRTYIIFTILFGVSGRLTNGSPLEYHQEIKESQPFTQVAPEPIGSTKHTAALTVGSRVLWHVCGGSIVTPSFVLTAGHCIEPLFDLDKNVLSTSRVIVGTDEWNQGGLRLRIKGQNLHPEWDYVFIKNDIGFIELLDLIVANAKIGFMALSFDVINGEEPSYLTAHETTEVSKNQKILHVTSITPEQCVEGIYAAGGRWAPPLDSRIEICTRNHDWDDGGPCNGDAGSALVLLEKNQQVGVVSWGFICPLKGPAVYVRISAYKEYIYSVLKWHN